MLRWAHRVIGSSLDLCASLHRTPCTVRKTSPLRVVRLRKVLSSHSCTQMYSAIRQKETNWTLCTHNDLVEGLRRGLRMVSQSSRVPIHLVALASLESPCVWHVVSICVKLSQSKFFTLDTVLPVLTYQLSRFSGFATVRPLCITMSCQRKLKTAFHAEKSENRSNNSQSQRV